MGRTILCEETNQAFINDIYSQKNVQTGLIVGQLTSQKDYAVLLVPTPVENEPEPEENEETDDVKTKSKSKENAALSLDSVSESWVGYHAKQVVRMLPGGLDIIGFYAAAPTKEMEKHASKLRQLIFAVHRSLSKSPLSPKPDDAITDRILLQICTLSRKLTCRSIDVGDNQSVLRPAEWKFQSVVDKWIVLRTKLALDFPIHVPKSGREVDINKKIQSSLKSIRKLVWNSMGTFAGNVRDANEALQVIQLGGKKTRSGKGYNQEGQQKFSVELFLQPPAEDDEENEEELGKVEEIDTKLTIQGTIHGEAFVHGKATVKEGLQALKCDLLRSLQARCSLMCEDIQGTGEGDAVGSQLQTPRRVFANILNKKITLCDYAFGDEQAADVIDRFKEVLGMTVEEEDLIFDMENMAMPEDIDAAEVKEDDKMNSKKKRSGLSGKAVVGAVVTGAVSALAVAFSYLYLEDIEYWD